jgi:hypothetical protein
MRWRLESGSVHLEEVALISDTREKDEWNEHKQFPLIWHASHCFPKGLNGAAAYHKSEVGMNVMRET